LTIEVQRQLFVCSDSKKNKPRDNSLFGLEKGDFLKDKRKEGSVDGVDGTSPKPDVDAGASHRSLDLPSKSRDDMIDSGEERLFEDLNEIYLVGTKRDRKQTDSNCAVLDLPEVPPPEMTDGLFSNKKKFSEQKKANGKWPMKILEFPPETYEGKLGKFETYRYDPMANGNLVVEVPPMNSSNQESGKGKNLQEVEAIMYATSGTKLRSKDHRWEKKPDS
jgi:hypothetical protein